MGKWYKSSLAKGIIIALEHILVGVIAVSLVWMLSYPNFFSDIFTEKPAEKVEDTASFEEQLGMVSQEVLKGMEVSHFVETNGVFDPERIVDIKEYVGSWQILNENKNGLAYKLGELDKWRQTIEGGSVYERESDGEESNPVIVCKKEDETYQYYFYKELESLIKNGELRFVIANDEGTDTGITSDEILLSLQGGYFYQGDNQQYHFKGIQDKEGKIEYIDCWNYDGAAIEEKYAPLGAESILDIVNNDPRWNGKLSQAYEGISNALDMLESDLTVYQNWKELWREGDTNLAYLYLDTENKKVYTNRENYKKYEDAEASIEHISKMGKYVIVKPRLSDFDTNLQDAQAESWRSFTRSVGAAKDNFIFAVGVDTKYPIQDEFYQREIVYEKYGSKVQLVGIMGCAAAILFIVGVIWLTAIAGRRTRDEALHLNAFDRWKTEIAAALVITAWIFPVLFISAGAGTRSTQYSAYAAEYTVKQMNGYDIMPNMILWIAIAVWTCALFLTGYLSLVRRLKGKTLWKNCILRVVLQFFKMIFSNMNILWKFILLFAAFVLIHWMTLSSGGSGILIAATFISEAAAFLCLLRSAVGRQRMRVGIERISYGEVNYKIPLDGLRGEPLMLAERVNAIGDGLDAALEKSIKSERLKTDLITNVSHDIKTPLTSIINYIDLLKKENLQDPKVQRYLEILEQKAQRLKTLTEDVVEASKVSSGNITLELMKINLVEMIQQTSGEFEEKLKARNLTEVLTLPDEELLIKADGRRIWRIIENVYNNAAKYAMEGSRIYADLSATNTTVTFNLKNVSQHPLNITADELTERFIRGDVSRSTEGSGLGLSIAKSLTTMQGGTFDLYLDGDLFKVMITFPRVAKEKS